MSVQMIQVTGKEQFFFLPQQINEFLNKPVHTLFLSYEEKYIRLDRYMHHSSKPVYCTKCPHTKENGIILICDHCPIEVCIVHPHRWETHWDLFWERAPKQEQVPVMECVEKQNECPPATAMIRIQEMKDIVGLHSRLKECLDRNQSVVYIYNDMNDEDEGCVELRLQNGKYYLLGQQRKQPIQTENVRLFFDAFWRNAPKSSPLSRPNSI